MFWKFNLASTHIDSLLEREEVTLQELLDEDDILQECKARHKKLIEFLIRPDNLREMVNMVTEEPSEDIEEKLRYRYPNTCCEVLTCDVTQINDCLTGDSVYINKLYGFLEMKGPLNPLLASFVSKVIGLLTVKKSEMIFKYLKSKSDFVGTLLTHIGTSAMVDLLLRLITCIESTKLKFEMIEWLNEQQLVERLVDQVVPSIEEDFHTNAAQFLCDIVRLGREQPSQIQDSPQPYPLLATLESEPVICRLLYNILDGEKNESVIVSGLLVIQILLDIKKIYEGEVDQRSGLDMEHLTQGVNHVLDALTPRIKDFHSLLLNPPKPRYCAMPTTIGILEPPLGNTRLQITKLITALIQTNSHEVNVELANSGTIGVMLDLYFKYIWNNFLHSQVEQCIYLILNNVPTEINNRKEHPLLEQIFIKCNLIQRILDSWEENDQYEHRIGGRRRGYMGHLTKIANHITECLEKGENSELVKEYLKEIPEEYKNKWSTFVSSTLAETNKQNTIELVQGHPLHSSSEDDDTDFGDLPFNQDAVMQQKPNYSQAFSDYQLQMTSNFIDTFGFNEHDFADQDGKIDTTFNEKISSIDFSIRADEDSAPNATMFEQACNERIQQFDDNDSDEEIWEKKEVILFENSPVRPTGMSTDSLGSDDQEEEEEDNTDSDEELDSPKCILQQPQEKMDVDTTEAMETSPWDAALVASETPEEKWANFNLKMSENNWADFSSFNSSLERIPRSSSPVAMDTGDTVSSSGCEDRNSQRSPQTRTVETAAKDNNDKSSKEDALWSGDTKETVTSKERSAKDDSSKSDSNQSANTDQTASSDNSDAEKVVNCTRESFLSSVGLIKPSNFGGASTSVRSVSTKESSSVSKKESSSVSTKESSSVSTTQCSSVATTESSSVSTTECSGITTTECSTVSTTDCSGVVATTQSSSVATTSVSTASNVKEPEEISKDKPKPIDDSVAKSTTSSTTDGNNESSKSNLIENIRSQAIEAMEKYEKAITASMKNGPV